MKEEGKNRRERVASSPKGKGKAATPPRNDFMKVILR